MTYLRVVHISGIPFSDWIHDGYNSSSYICKTASPFWRAALILCNNHNINLGQMKMSRFLKASTVHFLIPFHCFPLLFSFRFLISHIIAANLFSQLNALKLESTHLSLSLYPFNQSICLYIFANFLHIFFLLSLSFLTLIQSSYTTSLLTTITPFQHDFPLNINIHVPRCKILKVLAQIAWVYDVCINLFQVRKYIGRDKDNL